MPSPCSTHAVAFSTLSRIGSRSRRSSAICSCAGSKAASKPAHHGGGRRQILVTLRSAQPGTVCGKGFITPPMHGEGRSTVGISMSRCHLRRRRLSLTLARCCSVDSGARVALIAGGRKVRLIDVFHSGKGRLHHSAPLTGQSPKTSLGHPEWESRRTAPGNGKSAAERPQRVGRAVPNLRNGWFA